MRYRVKIRISGQEGYLRPLAEDSFEIVPEEEMRYFLKSSAEADIKKLKLENFTEIEKC